MSKDSRPPMVSQKSFQDLRFPRTGASAPRVCLRPREVSQPRLFLLKSVRECPTCGLRLPFDPSKISRSRDESTQKGTRSIDAAVDPNVRLASQPDCLPPCVFFRRRSGSGYIRRFIYSDDTSCRLYDRLAWHVSRAAPIARVLPSDIYNGSSRRLCIRFCSTRLTQRLTGSRGLAWLLKQMQIL